MLKFERGEIRLDFIYSIIGESCWFCDYNKGKKGRAVLDFHHVNPNNKSFTLSRTIRTYGWEKVKNEIKKCVLCCGRCHKKIELGLITPEAVNQKYIQFLEGQAIKLDEYENYVMQYKMDNDLIKKKKSDGVFRPLKHKVPPKEELEKLRLHMTNRQIADNYGVSKGTVRTWVNLYELPLVKT